MSFAVHCDWSRCDTWAYPELAVAAGFVSVAWGSELLHFCSWDCTIMYGAQIEPMKEV